MGSKKGKIAGKWKGRKKELHDLYSSPNCIQVVK